MKVKNNLLTQNYSVFAILLLAFFEVITYWKVPFLFFQQDEWLLFGLIIDRGLNILLRGLGTDNIFHFIPLDQLLNYLMFTAFRLNYIPYNIAGLLFHFLNGILVYFVCWQLTQKRLVTLLSGIIFLTSSVAAQLVMWPVVSLNTLSLTFTLLVWIFLLKLENLRSYKSIMLGIPVAIFTVLALLTLEYSINLLIFVPLSAFVLLGRRRVKYLIMFLLPFVILCFTYLVVRIYPVFVHSSGSTGGGLQLSIIGYKLSRLPLRYLGQLFLSEQVILSFSHFLSGKFNMVEALMFSKITTITGCLMIIVSSYIYFLIKRISTEDSKKFLLVLIFLITSPLPFIFIPGQAGEFLLFPPRYLYYGIVGYALFIAFLLKLIFLKENRLLKFFSIAVFFALILTGIIYNWDRENRLFLQGEIRQGILNSIKSNYPKLAKKVIFYTQSDRPYYGLPEGERILPFQSGFGQTLLMWYSASENFPKAFFQNKFLWEITDQGYKEVGENGFGYFRDIELLGKEVKKKDIPLESIIAFDFDSSLNRTAEITAGVRGSIKGFLATKKPLSQSEMHVLTTENPADAHLMLDGSRETFWDSKLPYAKAQSLTIDLGQQKNIAQIQIDSYSNKDQNEVGYRVLLSNDDNNWQEVFYAKRYSPDKNGIINLYFNPQSARFIKIEQKGFHQFSPWVIHELKIFKEI